MRGPRPPYWFTCDGCTFSPDSFGPYDWTEACRWHDWAYRSDVRISRWMADWYLARNMVELGCRKRWAVWYWIGVRLFGWRFWRRSKP